MRTGARIGFLRKRRTKTSVVAKPTYSYDVSRESAPGKTPRKETAVEIREFERVFRTAIGDDPMPPAFAITGDIGQVKAELPTEFQAAMRTLCSRTTDPAKANGLLRATAAQWT